MAKSTMRDHQVESPRKGVPIATVSRLGEVPAGIVRDHRKTGVEYIFVLMLENRSFDHLLGFSGIGGTDALTGKPTSINGLKGNESNSFNGHTYTVSRGAPDVMPNDPGHEFEDVLVQLCGTGAKYASGGTYPPINSSGYAASYASKGNPEDVMKCFEPGHLPVLEALAKEFVVCDNWYASMPGPTWPNRMFAHAGSSGGLDNSPDTDDISGWELAPRGGFGFKNGTVYDQLRKAKIRYRFYAGDDFPMVAALKGVSITEIRDFSEHFAKDLHANKVDFKYAFLEPSYDVLNHYRGGTSQHPLGHVAHGEAFIKAVYEAVRDSTVWEKSLLIITWDEHGGFFDHADSGHPPQCVAPGDTKPGSKYNKHGFTFEHFGPRVPAIVISPLIPKNLIDHRVYDHASIPATIARVFGTRELTRRDSFANSLNTLCALKTARSDTPKALPSPGSQAMARLATPTAIGPEPAADPEGSVNSGNLPVILYSALRQDLLVSPTDQQQAIIERAHLIRTRAQALDYMRDVQQKIRTRRAAAVP